MVVTNALGKATSATALLKVSDGPPFFVVQPASLTITNGVNVSLTALARGSDPLSYQWRRGSSVLSGAHDSSLSFSNISVAGAGFSDVVVFNTFGSATTSLAQVTVYEAPLLLQGLSNQIVDAKSTVLLAVGATGVPALGYAWQFNGVGLPNATNSSLLLSNVQPAQSGYYSVNVANLLGSVSSTGRMSVFGRPSSVVVWGDDSGGQADVPLDSHNVIAVCGGDFHTVVLRHNGTLAAWGYNGDGQTDLPTNATRFVSLASGAAHNLAITEAGSVIAWGRNDSGQLNVPANAASVLAVAAGDAHSVALLPSGTVLAWGNNSYGQTTTPPQLSGVTLIAAGRNHNLALRTNGTVVTWGLNNSGQASAPQSLVGHRCSCCRLPS